jgi:DNA-binding MarR family transcriptional regulator
MQEVGLLFKWIALSDRYGKMYMDRMFEPMGFNSSQHMFILHVCENEGITQEKLQSFVPIDKSNIARGVAKLCENGFFVKEVCDEDKRSARIYPTEKALAAYPVIIEVENRMIDLLTDGFSADEHDLLHEMMEKTAQNAIELLREEK